MCAKLLAQLSLYAAVRLGRSVPHARALTGLPHPVLAQADQAREVNHDRERVDTARSDPAAASALAPATLALAAPAAAASALALAPPRSRNCPRRLHLAAALTASALAITTASAPPQRRSRLLRHRRLRPRRPALTYAMALPNAVHYPEKVNY